GGEVDDLGDGDLAGPGAAAFEVGDEVLREGPQDAGDDPLLFDGQVAAVGVGDGREPLVDAFELSLVAAAGGDAVQRVGDLAGPELARRALATRLDVE